MTFRLNVPYADIAKEGEYDKDDEYFHYSRLDLLCGFKWKQPLFPCRICGKETCDGENKECKNEGAYTLGLSCID
jgi:hypothetical protein